jgi:RNA polymerase sigma factor (sigma-70 family)
MKQNEIVRLGHDPDAFEAFYREHLERVQKFVARRVDDPHLAADLTADIFMAVVESADSYQPDRGSPVGWLYGIARNVVADQSRQQARELQAMGRISGRRMLDPDSLSRIEERIDAERQLRELAQTFSELSDDDQALMELVAIEGLSVKEAAAVLGVKPGTARVRLHRSRALLQNQHQLTVAMTAI